ncbi:hypothetical protein Terro_2489 [Terriglobus roseus DSM 18391]|uniref:TrbI/VirB10 family protein n=1 Tax=Terriglobus roseus (strain DSM 18391 / NRRL B-41598 / KBS 63) TaxID=926566 RepID=I3ZGM8_TERRK|nr:hypothetical protein [Terriglobus roseus]AFL88396.1 hypothetical protein Terro_2125 [Terriglobus roseus DSM 18391]AFL88737.1 hypothetical protein Terro_2489 [Terriglobus roseus DSM 18391]
MKPQIALALIVAMATPVFAQQTGVSRPPEDSVADLPIPAPAAKPSAAIPMSAPASSPVASEQYGEYKPYVGPGVTLRPRIEEKVDPDAGVVGEMPRRADELPINTLMHIRLRSAIATQTTQPNTPFTAELAEDILNEGRVVLPAGSTVEGRITQVRGGRRIRGSALIHLEVETVVLPDGARKLMRAMVIDTDQTADTRIDEEGNILRKDHVGATLAAMSLTTGGAAAAGGIIGGAPGALIGAGVGAGLSTAWWLKQDRQARVPEGTVLVISLTEPMAIGGSARQPEFSQRTVPVLERRSSTVNAEAEPTTRPYVAPQAFVPTN